MEIMIPVTVIIPCHNCEKFVTRAIKSVLSQSFKVTEILLIENNSTDSTKQVLQQFKSEYPDLIKIYSEGKQGACAARNLGLAKAKGEWIQFLDADDELLPKKIESQLSLISLSKPDVIVGNYCKVIVTGNKSSRRSFVVEKDPWLGIINSALGVTSAMLWNKRELLKVKGWKEGLSSSQEYDLIFRLLKNGASLLADHNEHTVIYTNVESVSRSSNSERLVQILCNRYGLRCKIYEFLNTAQLLTPAYKKNLDCFLFYHLLLISEFNMAYFKEQITRIRFQDISRYDKIAIFIDFIKHSSFRNPSYTNLIQKIAELHYILYKKINFIKFII
ncbi:glycosyltransferase family 2 protein [Pontibacter sp. BT731]|uniref:glycosyltransferase family 2 protein n=1 Tax=Pontibacter coccineus TaxID=3063328 RepID=UPI0026E2D852|nr:glycosyltransferase family 2 protein [Pontibacter sp. BT731]MDO6390990.1 glycosyltransferase family 2 protein [Pontibacter sp. BT731]